MKTWLTSIEWNDSGREWQARDEEGNLVDFDDDLGRLTARLSEQFQAAPTKLRVQIWESGEPFRYRHRGWTRMEGERDA